MSSSDVLRKFIKRDMSSPQSRRALDELFRSPCYGYFLKNLRGPDILGYVDFLDKALNLIPTTDELWTSCLSALRQICEDRAVLPTTHVLSQGSVKRGKVSMIIHDTDSCWEAQYKRTAVCVRSIQMLPGSEPALMKKFCHEVVLWKRLNHPNLASVLGVTMDPYQVVFDRVSDKDIIKYIMGGGVDRVSLISDIAEGLGYLHSYRVVHGRLGTGDIFVNDDGRAMLTDYGSTSVVWDPEDISQQIIRCCAPEVLGKAFGTRPTCASDVFSFGMVVLEMFSGKAPFDGVPDDEVKWIRSGGRPSRPLGTANLGLSDTLWELVQQCWDDSPELRPGMADVLKYIRKAHSAMGTECSEAPTLVNPNAALEVNDWKGFSNLLPAVFRLVRRKPSGGALTPTPGGG